MRELGRVAAVSRVYESAPVGGPEQSAFFNAAALLVTELDPLALLDALLAIEVGLGRVRRERWGPRTIDLDVLWIDGLAFDHPRLRVPHPHLTERAFAMRTLHDVAPSARDPRTGAPLTLDAAAETQALTALDASL